MATSEEYIQSILTGIGTIQNHRHINESVVRESLKNVDDAVSNALDDLSNLEYEEDEG